MVKCQNKLILDSHQTKKSKVIQNTGPHQKNMHKEKKAKNKYWNRKWTMLEVKLSQEVNKKFLSNLNSLIYLRIKKLTG